MNKGDVIAVRGSGPRAVRLLFEARIDDIDYGILVGPDGEPSRPSPVAAILARGYWQLPNPEETPNVRDNA